MTKGIYLINGEEISPNWEVNDELKKVVYEGMPSNLSIEEKALYIYFRLCQLLIYDEQFIYLGQSKEKYEIGFSKYVLEGVKPNSSIVCPIISRIFYKLISDLNDSNIESYFYIDRKGHAYTGFRTSSIEVELDATRINNERKSNDLFHLKIGSNPNGITVVEDKFDELPNMIPKVYEMVYGKKPVSLQDKLSELRELSSKEFSTDEDITLEQKIKAFCKVLKTYNINGNEAVSALVNYKRFGFLGEKLKLALCAERPRNYGDKYRRKVIIRKYEEVDGNFSYFLFDTETLSVEPIKKENLMEKFRSEEFKFEPSPTNKHAKKMEELLGL